MPSSLLPVDNSNACLKLFDYGGAKIGTFAGENPATTHRSLSADVCLAAVTGWEWDVADELANQRWKVRRIRA